MRSQSPAEQKGSNPTGTPTIQANCLLATLCGKLKEACLQIGCLSCADRHSMNFVAAESGNLSTYHHAQEHAYSCSVQCQETVDALCKSFWPGDMLA